MEVIKSQLSLETEREREVKIVVLKKTRMDVCFLLGANSEWPVIPLGNGKLRRDIIALPKKALERAFYTLLF